MPRISAQYTTIFLNGYARNLLFPRACTVILPNEWFVTLEELMRLCGTHDQLCNSQYRQYMKQGTQVADVISAHIPV